MFALTVALIFTTSPTGPVRKESGYFLARLGTTWEYMSVTHPGRRIDTVTAVEQTKDGPVATVEEDVVNEVGNRILSTYKVAVRSDDHYRV